MKNKEKLISIILNCYNGGDYLKEALVSVKNQTYKNWELIFWDNKSKDNSKQILESFKNKRFKYFLSKKHTSLYSARNLAITKTKGDFISFIDSDDIWEKNKLKRQIKFFKDKKVAVVYGNLWLKKQILNKKKKFINYKVKDGYVYNSLINNYNVGILTSIIRKSFLKNKKKIFNDKYNIIGDFDLFINLSKKYKFKFIQEPIATYRIHEKNLSILKKDLQIKELNNWLKNNKKDLTKKDYHKIKSKITRLEFINKKFSCNFFETLIFYVKSCDRLNNFRDILILFFPKIILRKIMWFI